jgi:hypothetical protein
MTLDQIGQSYGQALPVRFSLVSSFSRLIEVLPGPSGQNRSIIRRPSGTDCRCEFLPKAQTRGTPRIV